MQKHKSPGIAFNWIENFQRDLVTMPKQMFVEPHLPESY